MKNVAVILASVLFMILQLVAVDSLAIGKIAPDFPIMIVVVFALYRPVIEGTIFGFVIGFVQDLYNPVLMGLNALLKSIMGYVLGEVGSRTVPEGAPFLALVLFLSHLTHDLLYMFVYFKLHLLQIMSIFFTETLPSALYTAVLGAALYELGKLLMRRVVRAVGKAR